MGTKTVEVEIDLDEFDTDDLVDEVVSRISKTWSIKQLTDRQKQELRDSVEPLFDELINKEFVGIEINTLEDEMKRDHFVKIWNKYTLTQIEQLIP